MKRHNINKKEIPKIIKKFDEVSPHFPDGRIDYSNSKTAAAVNILVKYKDNILILKRSDKVYTAKEKWNSITGHFDKVKSTHQMAMEELSEEIGISEEDILQMKIEKYYKFVDSFIQKKWIIYPIFVKLKYKPEIKLNWENTEYKWIKFNEINNYDIVPPLERLLKNFIEY